MNNIEIKNKRSNTDIETGDIYQNKETGCTVRVLSKTARLVNFVYNDRVMTEDRLDFMKNNKFKSRS